MTWNKRAFLYQAGILSASNLALQLLGFLYRILLSRLVGSEGMGVYTLVMQVYTIVISLCISGLTVAVTTLCARHFAKNDISAVRRLTKCALICFLLLFALVALPVIFFHREIAAGFLGDPRTDHALLMVLGCIFLTGFENILKATFNGARLVRRTAISEVGEVILRIGAVTALLYFFKTGEHGFSAFLILLGMTISEIYSVVFLSISYYRCFMRGPAPKKQPGIWRSLFKIALPAAGTAIVCNLFSSLATILFPARLLLAGYDRGKAVSALGVISGMAAPLMMLPMAFISAVCTLLMPSISGAIATKDYATLRRKVDKGIQVTGLIALPCTALLLSFVPLLCALIFRQTIDVQLALLLGVQTVVGYYLMTTVCILNGMSLQRQVLGYAIVGEILQLMLVYVLTALPSLHVYGYLLGMISGDILRVMLGLRKIYRITGVKKRPFSNYAVPAATAVILWCLARIIFFFALKGGATSAGAIATALFVCGCVYWVILRLLGVRTLQYFRRNVLRR